MSQQPSTPRRPTLWLIGLLAVAVVAVVALAVWILQGQDEDDTASPTATPTTSPAQTASPTPSPSASPTSGPTAQPTPTPSPAPAPTTPAVPGASLGPFSGGGTQPAPNGTWIADVRSAAQPGYDRVVFEFTDVVPTYRVEYADPPFIGIPGDPVPVEGQAFLRVRMDGTSAFNLIEAVPVYTGPQRITSDTEVVTEVVNVEDFEAVVVWVIGLEQQRPFRAWTLDGPSRLVIDVEQ